MNVYGRSPAKISQEWCNGRSHAKISQERCMYVYRRSPAKISQEWCMEGQLQKYLILCSCQSTTLQLEAIQVSDVKKISHAIHLPNLNHTAGVMYWKSSIKISYFEIVITIEQKTWSPYRGNCCFNVT
jgi:hypothetical protein